MLTDFSEIKNNFEVNFGVDFDLFVLHFPGSHFYEFLVGKEKKKKTTLNILKSRRFAFS